MIKTLLLIVEVSRIFGPLTIFINPLFGFVVSLVLDIVDGPLFFRAGYPWKYYNIVDKIMDYWFYVLIVIYSRSLIIFPVILFLFFYRTIGQVLGIIKENEKIYLYFPNILQWYFVLYCVYWQLGRATDFISIPHQVLALVVSSLFALLIEWLIHVDKKSYIARYIFNTPIDWEKNK